MVRTAPITTVWAALAALSLGSSGRLLDGCANSILRNAALPRH